MVTFFVFLWPIHVHDDAFERFTVIVECRWSVTIAAARPVSSRSVSPATVQKVETSSHGLWPSSPWDHCVMKIGRSCNSDDGIMPWCVPIVGQQLLDTRSRWPSLRFRPADTCSSSAVLANCRERPMRSGHTFMLLIINRGRDTSTRTAGCR